MNDGGKGSARRPGDGYQDGWDRIFSKKPQRHFFVHQGSGIYTCVECGKNEKYAHSGEECPGKAK